ncbi:MAG: Ku protein, partial [Acidobacteriaceae bacterium]|nr:Ku protein [Acidobacteriaceae bacterium]
LVTVPVKLYTAVEPKAAISFNMIHAGCGSRLRQQPMVCEKGCGEVGKESTVKGYEYAKGNYVTFTADEIKAMTELPTHTIEIDEWMPSDAVDPVYFDKPYYLAPDKGGAKGLSLLCEVMKAAGKVAIARYAARGKGHVVMLRPLGNYLVMQQLLYAAEVRPATDVPTQTVDVRDEELELALLLVEQASVETFEPAKYKDAVTERIQAAIARKVAGGDVTAGAVQSVPVQPQNDLMAALKASIKDNAAKRKPRKKNEAA